MNKIKEARKAYGWSQQQLADKMGVARSTIAMWENESSQPDNNSLIALSKCLNKSTDYLLGIEEAAAVPEVSEAPEAASDNDIKFALFGGENIEEITDEMMDDVRHYAQFLKEKKKKEK